MTPLPGDKSLTNKPMLLVSRFILILGCLFATASSAFSAQESLRRFLGTWEAKSKGRVLLVLRLAEGQPLSGTMTSANLSKRADNSLNGTIEEKDYPILKPKVSGNKLTYQWRRSDDGDEDELLQCEMKITREGEALLRFTNAPKGVEPYRLRKTQ